MTKAKSVVGTVTAGAIGLGILIALAPAATAQTTAQSPVGGTKRCNAYWHSHRAALKAQGKTKKDFMGPCLSGTWVFQ